MEPVNVKNLFAQGDLLGRRVAELPEGAKPADPETHNGKPAHIVAHSETGHDHFLYALGVEKFDHPSDPNICYLKLESPALLEHARAYDTHQTIRLPAGIFEIRRQTEWTPEGFRRVED